MKPQVKEALQQLRLDQYFSEVECEVSCEAKDPSDALHKYGSLIDDCFHRGESVKECADKIISKVQKRDYEPGGR